VTDKLPGGLADNKTIDDFDQEQLMKGLQVELEHTRDTNLALEIAMDHLTEHPDYYTALEDMEEDLESDCLNPIRRNDDYGGNYLDKIRRRIARRGRKRAMRKIAQEEKFRAGQTVEITSGYYTGATGTIQNLIGNTNEGLDLYKVTLDKGDRTFSLPFTSNNFKAVDTAEGVPDGSPQVENSNEEFIEEDGIRIDRAEDGGWYFKDIRSVGYRLSSMLRSFNERAAFSPDINTVRDMEEYLIKAPKIRFILEEYIVSYNYAPDRVKFLYREPEFIERHKNRIEKSFSHPSKYSSCLKMADVLYQHFPEAVENAISNLAIDFIVTNIIDPLGSARFLYNKAINGDERLYKIIGDRVYDMMPGHILKHRVYENFKEQSKDKLFSSERITGSINNLLKLKDVYPEEAVRYRTLYFLSNPKKTIGFQDFNVIWEELGEYQETFLASLDKNVSSADLFHAYKFSDALKADMTLPHEFWLRKAANLAETKPTYFMTIEAYNFPGIPEDTIKKAYDSYWENGYGRDIATSLMTDSGFDELIGRFGVSRDSIIFHAPDAGSRVLGGNAPNWAQAVFSVASELDGELSELEIEFGTAYIKGSFWKHDPNAGENLRRIFNHPQIKVSGREFDSVLNSLNSLELKDEKKATKPFISETRANSILDEAGNDSHTIKGLVNLKLYNKIIEPSPELTARYAKSLATHNPSAYLEKSLTGERVRTESAESFYYRLIEGKQDITPEQKKDILKALNEQFNNDRENTGDSVMDLYPQFKDIAIENLYQDHKTIDHAIRALHYIGIEFEDIQTEVRTNFVNNLMGHIQSLFLLQDMKTLILI